MHPPSQIRVMMQQEGALDLAVQGDIVQPRGTVLRHGWLGVTGESIAAISTVPLAATPPCGCPWHAHPAGLRGRARPHALGSRRRHHRGHGGSSGRGHDHCY